MIEAVFMVCLTLILLLGPYVPPRFWQFLDLTPLDQKGPHSPHRLWGLVVVLPDWRPRPGSRSDASAKNFTSRYVPKVFVENLCDSNFWHLDLCYLDNKLNWFSVRVFRSAWLDRQCVALNRLDCELWRTLSTICDYKGGLNYMTVDMTHTMRAMMASLAA